MHSPEMNAGRHRGGEYDRQSDQPWCPGHYYRLQQGSRRDASSLGEGTIFQAIYICNDE